MTVRHGKVDFLLKHHADRLMRALYRLAGDGDAPVVAVEQPADDVEQCGLAAARGADHGKEFTRRHVERHVVDSDEHTLGCLELFRYVIDDEQGLGRRGARCSVEARDRHHAFLSAFDTAAVMAGV